MVRVFVVTLALVGANAFAAGPCEQIVNACKASKFVPNTAKEGTGLWKDCVRPIMQGTPQPAKAVLPLPSIDPATVAACKAKRPNFGEGNK
jgi:hypothetical protein